MITVVNTQEFRPVSESVQVPLENFVALEQIMLNVLSPLIPQVLLSQYQLNSRVWVLHRYSNGLNPCNGIIFSDPLSIVSAMLASGNILPNQNGILFESLQSNCTFASDTFSSPISFPPILMAKSTIEIHGNDQPSEVWGVVSMKLVDRIVVQLFINSICDYVNHRVKEFGLKNVPNLPYLDID